MSQDNNITEILLHTIEYWWVGGECPEDRELDECDEEHIRDMIGQGYVEGELNSGEEEYRGWWRIKRGRN